jgi:folate-binding protein YgfZ
VIAVVVPRDVIEVTGPESATFLQGQLSQDIAKLAPGESTWSFVLQPAGKVDGFVRIVRTAAEGFVLDTEQGFGDALIARLNRFKLRTKAAIAHLPWRCVWVFDAERPERYSHGWLVTGWPGESQYAVIGETVEPPVGAELADVSFYERRRIETGWPAMGAELDEHTIPGEAEVVPVAVSFTKGCYTGQELVARIDSRGGNVPRHLRRVVASDDEIVALGADLVIDDRVVGRVTSASGEIGLAYVARGVELPDSGTVGGVNVEVSGLGG